MKAGLVKVLPIAVRLMPVILLLILLAASLAEGGGLRGPPDFDPY